MLAREDVTSCGESAERQNVIGELVVRKMSLVPNVSAQHLRTLSPTSSRKKIDNNMQIMDLFIPSQPCLLIVYT